MTSSFLMRAATVATVAVAAITVSASAAQAQRLEFVSSVLLSTTPGSTATGVTIDFLSGDAFPTTPGGTTGNIFAVPTIQAPFAPSVFPGLRGTIADLTTTMTSVGGLPIANFVQLGDYTFSLTSTPTGSAFGPITLFDGGTGTLGFFGVRGVVTGGAYGMTGANYVGDFTLNFAGRTPEQVLADLASPMGLSSVSVSAGFTVTSVIPEPSTYALLATGLGALGLTAARRRRSNV